MGSSRLRTGLVVLAVAATALGGLVIPATTASAVVAVPTGLLPNDPDAAPTSSNPGASAKNVVLTWTPISGVTSYQVQVSNSRGTFDPPSIDVATSVAAYAPSSSLPHADYAWRVRVAGGTWSSAAYFTRGWDAAPTNLLVSYKSGGGPTFTWDAVPDASYYEFQWSDVPFRQGNDPTDGNVTNDPKTGTCLTATTELTPYTTTQGSKEGVLPGEETKTCTEFSGSLYWRVRARDGVYSPETTTISTPAYDCTGVWYGKDPLKDALKSECSDWGYPATLGFSELAPISGTAPTSAPDNLDIGPRLGTSNTSPVEISATPTFSWDGVPGSTFYRVYQTRDKKAETGDHTWETTATNLSPVIQEPDLDVRAYWRVQACNVSVRDGNNWVLTYDKDSVKCGPVSDWATYYQHTPATVTNSSATVVPNGWRLQWTTAADPSKTNSGDVTHLPDAAGYDVQLSDWYGSFENPVKTFQVDRQEISQSPIPGESLAYVPSSVLPAGQSGFLWRVRGVDSSGNKYPWSTATKVGSLASAKATLTTGTNFALNAPMNFTFNAPVSNVNSGTARIVALSNGAAFPGSVGPTNSAGTAFRFTPSRFWVAGESYRLQLYGVVTQGTGSTATTDPKIVRAARTVDSASPYLTRVTGDYGWTTSRASDAQGSSFIRSDDKTSTSKRSSVYTTMRGSSVDVYACKSNTSGYFSISVDGVYKTKVNLYKSYNDCGRVARVTLTSTKAHSIRFNALGTKDKKSKGHQVRFDAFVVN